MVPVTMNLALISGLTILCDSCTEYRFPDSKRIQQPDKVATRSAKLRASNNSAPAKSTSSFNATAKSKQKQASTSNSSNKDILSTNKEPAKVSCTVCNNSCTGGSLVCDICLNVYDQQCSTLPTDVFNILLSIVQSSGWVCMDCRSSCRDQIKQLHAAQAKMAEKLAEIEISLTAESTVYRIDNCHADQSTPVHSLNSVHDIPLIVEKNAARSTAA